MDPYPESRREYTVVSGCNGSGLSSAGGIGKVAAEIAIALKKEDLDPFADDWSPLRASLSAHTTTPDGNPVDVRGQEFRDLCSNARSAKFQ